MKQRRFEELHETHWRRFRHQLEILERGQREDLGRTSLEDFPETYRQLCHQQSLARERGYSLPLVQRLDDLVLAGHRHLYRHRLPLAAPVGRFIAGGFPRAVREQWQWNLVSALFFLGALAFLWILVRQQPEMIYSLLDEVAVRGIEDMYDPSGTHRDQRTSTDDLTMFGYYIWNNVGIAFRTFAGGLFFGIGAAIVELFNGGYFGAVAAHLVNLDYHRPFFTFVIAHGAPELTAIVLAGGSGLRVGWALVDPGPRRRLDALRHAARAAMPVMYGVFGLLLLAAFIEAFWSPRTFAPWIKYGAGGGAWLVLYAWLFLGGRR